MTKQNDIVTCVMRINDFQRKVHNTNIFVTGANDGAVKAYFGERKKGTIS